MKDIKFQIIVASLVGIILLTGCANFGDGGKSTHEVTDWAPTPNRPTNFFAALVTPVKYKVHHEKWTDTSRGGGTFLMTDPAASQIDITRSNQAALGGGHSAKVGNVASTISTNAVALTKEIGNAVANGIAAGVKAAATP